MTSIAFVKALRLPLYQTGKRDGKTRRGLLFNSVVVNKKERSNTCLFVRQWLVIEPHRKRCIVKPSLRRLSRHILRLPSIDLETWPLRLQVPQHTD